MSTIIERFNKIKSNIDLLKPLKQVNIIAVSKTFSLTHIQPLVNYGHNHYGENKVQEALAKWNDLKKERNDLKLHMIGKLQSNKAKAAIEIFDYIHSLDNQKLADTLSKGQKNINKILKYFIQASTNTESISKITTFFIVGYFITSRKVIKSPPPIIKTFSIFKSFTYNDGKCTNSS